MAILHRRFHTRAIEIVANAKGSPTMLPRLKAELLRYSTILSYFFKDGEWSDPYGGMKNLWPRGSRVAGEGSQRETPSSTTRTSTKAEAEGDEETSRSLREQAGWEVGPGAGG